jgi:glycerol kinase
MPMSAVLAIDQGTTSTKSLVIHQDGSIIGTSSPKHFGVSPQFPRAGWVEFDPFEILDSVRQSAKSAIRNSGLKPTDISAIGLANQGETVIAFDADTGIPVLPAISWQDRRGQGVADRWRAEGLRDEVFRVTGLQLDSYFSAPKLSWILENVPQARALLKSSRLRFGTSDAWLIWQLTQGHHFATDVATASRTMVMDLSKLDWNSNLLEAFGIPLETLPKITSNSGSNCVTSNEILGFELPVTGICVDQQAALFGQRAFADGDVKITYGTGCFVLANIGETASLRAPGLVTSVGWDLSEKTTFVFDGGVYSAGSLVDWLCRLGIASDVYQVATLAQEAGTGSQVVLVPAFSGLAAPRWSSLARACWVGMNQSTDASALAQSALESIAFSVKEIIDAMRRAGVVPGIAKVDGGLSRCDLLMQIQADLLEIPLARSEVTECTALGVGYLAGLGSGLWSSLKALPPVQTTERVFEPQFAEARGYSSKFARWKEICSRVIAMGDDGLFSE